MVRPSPRTSIPLFSTLETAPVRDASSLARKRRVLRKVKALSVRLICGDDGRVRGWKWRDFVYSTENHVKPLLELTNPQHNSSSCIIVKQPVLVTLIEVCLTLGTHIFREVAVLGSSR
ncbi:hypothetical protein DY000_02057027 [Brassica cretica]|uniref:Uncharacterized protein n=1 Tax=Brassica cretica TaxID=69181 RepID=A0ABQ7ACX2_BRACR|nr:hypothetical protein DY000_02057027 [Brassica cretica]